MKLSIKYLSVPTYFTDTVPQLVTPAHATLLLIESVGLYTVNPHADEKHQIHGSTQYRGLVYLVTVSSTNDTGIR